MIAALGGPSGCNVTTKEKITMTFQIARPRPHPTQKDALTLSAYWKSISCIPNQHPATRAFALREAAHWTRTAAAIARARQEAADKLVELQGRGAISRRKAPGRSRARARRGSWRRSSVPTRRRSFAG